MPQHEHMERHAKLHGRRFDAEERERKKEARLAHKRSDFAQKVHGIRAKLYHKRRYKEKATMRKTINQHSERDNKHADDDAVADGAVPAYLLDRQGVSRAKVLSNTIKQKRKEKAGKWEVPIPKVKPVADDEMFKVMRTGTKRQKVRCVALRCVIAGVVAAVQEFLALPCMAMINVYLRWAGFSMAVVQAVLPSKRSSRNSCFIILVRSRVEP